MQSDLTLNTSSTGKVIIKKCHLCGHIMESNKEVEKCSICQKSFLPSNYFGKIHAHDSESYKELFMMIEELHEDDLVKGINVIW